MRAFRVSAVMLLMLFYSICLMNCSRENLSTASELKKLDLDAITFQHSMKGWELYSWPVGSNWNYSILAGTNRAKTLEEITSNPITVSGKDSLKLLLSKFPANENLFWSGKTWNNNAGNLSLPDQLTITEIQGYCTQKSIVLNISN